MAKKPTMASVAWGTAQNAFRRLVGLKPTKQQTIADYGLHYVRQWVAQWGGTEQAKLPSGWPADVFATLDRLVRARGGVYAVGDGVNVPCFSLDRKAALTLPHMWIVNIDVHGDVGNIANVLRLEETLEDALARECNKKLNIRILTKPLRIEIDKLTPDTRTLAQRWAEFGDRKPGSFLVGDYWDGSAMTTGFMSVSNANEFSGFFVGGSGSGKTQLMLGALLTIAYSTPPTELSIVVVDPKSLDFPVGKLPHLAGDIITDPVQATQAIMLAVAEMDRRVAAKDRKAAHRRVLICIDELADLLAVQKSGDLEMALQRLAQKGRAWGFSLWVGSQRPTKDSMPQSVLQNIPCRFVGRVGSATEAALASGKDGCDAHRLPGKGSFQVYCPGVEDGLRIQGLFVADANADDYEKRLNKFMTDIAQRWAGKHPHWRLDDSDDGGGSGDVLPLPTVDDSAAKNAMATLAELDETFVAALWRRYTEAGELSQRAVRSLHKETVGRDLNPNKAAAILDAVSVGYATIFATGD